MDDQMPRPTKKRSSIFTLKEMEAATCSFSDENLLGKGGLGRVYKGTRPTGDVVAIKKMELPPFKKAEGEREFRVEVDILSRLNHPNLVSLIGIDETRMNWPSRLKVTLGAARGFVYLHSSSALGIPIVHRDFKSTNVLNTKIKGKCNRNTTGKLTLQSDVYAFRVVLLELLMGRRAVNINQGPNNQNLVLQVMPY
ncbi:Detected protein of confused Function [Hibiscus syriacus]|uniref:Detected protein of confused Function n=1 Tax=Hibiscus syriacus TaxID=106335 RepID=A0A6A2ZGG8_HIBSY|nr:Detected protein of confused Function [Hibiscus syriacus]